MPNYRWARIWSEPCERELVKQRLNGIDFLEDVGERHEFRVRQVRAYRLHKPWFGRSGHGSGVRHGPDELPQCCVHPAKCGKCQSGSSTGEPICRSPVHAFRGACNVSELRHALLKRPPKFGRRGYLVCSDRGHKFLDFGYPVFKLRPSKQLEGPQVDNLRFTQGMGRPGRLLSLADDVAVLLEVVPEWPSPIIHRWLRD